jgi:hypothetical protein
VKTPGAPQHGSPGSVRDLAWPARRSNWKWRLDASYPMQYILPVCAERLGSRLWCFFLSCTKMAVARESLSLRTSRAHSDVNM